MTHQSSPVAQANVPSPSPSWWVETDAIVVAHAMMNTPDEAHNLAPHDINNAIEEVHVGIEQANVGAEEANVVIEDANADAEDANAVIEVANAGSEELDVVSDSDSITGADVPAIIRLPVPFVRRVPAPSEPLESIPMRLVEIVNSLVSASMNTPHPFILPETRLVIELGSDASLNPIYDRVLSLEADCRGCLRRLTWDALKQELRRLSARYEAILQALFGAHQVFWALLREQSSQGKRINHGLSQWSQVAPIGNDRQMRAVEDDRLYWEGRESVSRNALVSAWYTCGNLVTQYVSICQEVASFFSRTESTQLRAESYFLNICAELGIQEEFVPSSLE